MDYLKTIGYFGGSCLLLAGRGRRAFGHFWGSVAWCLAKVVCFQGWSFFRFVLSGLVGISSY